MHEVKNRPVGGPLIQDLLSWRKPKARSERSDLQPVKTVTSLTWTWTNTQTIQTRCFIFRRCTLRLLAAEGKWRKRQETLIIFFNYILQEHNSDDDLPLLPPAPHGNVSEHQVAWTCAGVTEFITFPSLSLLTADWFTYQRVIGWDLSSDETLLPLKPTHLLPPSVFLSLSVLDSLCSARSPLALSSPGKMFDFLYLFFVFF